jgi:hypothetical protein
MGRRDRAALADSKYRRSSGEYAAHFPDDAPASSFVLVAPIVDEDAGAGSRWRGRRGRRASAKRSAPLHVPENDRKEIVVSPSLPVGERSAGANAVSSMRPWGRGRRRGGGGAKVANACDSCVGRECGTLATHHEEASFRLQLDAVLLRSLADLENREAAEVAHALDLSIASAFESMHAEEKRSPFDLLDAASAASSGYSSSASPSSTVPSGGDASDGTHSGSEQWQSGSSPLPSPARTCWPPRESPCRGREQDATATE